MDMDSTLITIECIDELGGYLDVKEKISRITSQAMRGEIDFPESLRQRVALLAGLHEDALQEVYDEKLRLSPGAEQLIGHCKRHGVNSRSCPAASRSSPGASRAPGLDETSPTCSR
jgi:phosphoserine phosphatase